MQVMEVCNPMVMRLFVLQKIWTGDGEYHISTNSAITNSHRLLFVIAHVFQQ
jgi:hypothetical protein